MMRFPGGYRKGPVLFQYNINYFQENIKDVDDVLNVLFDISMDMLSMQLPLEFLPCETPPLRSPRFRVSRTFMYAVEVRARR